MLHCKLYYRWQVRFVTIVCLLFIHSFIFSQVFPVDSIMHNGRRSNRINFVYMSDGFKNSQQPLFITNTNTINDALFATTPFSEYHNYFNAFAIKVPSDEKGAIHPGTASDEPIPSQPVENPNNYFKSTFDFFNIHRLLVPENNVGINGVLSSNLPDYDQGFIVVNSPYYGGSGGQFATASTDPSSAEVAIHEIGHSFAGLADEYWAGISYAAEKPNMTANNDPATIKWKRWLNINNIGIYPYGGSAPLSNWFKPHPTCKMQYLGQPFCAVCTERFIDQIHNYVNMIDDYAPAATSFSLNNTNPVPFSVQSIATTPNTIITRWYLNDSLYNSSLSAISIPYDDFKAGSNSVKVEVIDTTNLSKSYLQAIGYVNSTEWSVTKSGALPVLLTNFSGVVKSKSGVLNWSVDNSKDVQRFELGKSKDGVSFSFLTSIDKEQENRFYSFTDPDLLTPVTFYRLKVIQKDGTSFFSPVIRLQNTIGNFVYKVYQNADLHRYHLTTNLSDNEKVAIQITDNAGKLILRKDFGKVSGQLDYNIDLAGKAAGIYFMTININHSNYVVQLLAK